MFSKIDFQENWNWLDLNLVHTLELDLECVYTQLYMRGMGPGWLCRLHMRPVRCAHPDWGARVVDAYGFQSQSSVGAGKKKSWLISVHMSVHGRIS